MNKILITILFLFVALLGCKKDPAIYTITSSVSDGGTIDPLGVTSVEEGSSVIYTIKPDDHYSIASIKVDGFEAPVSGTIEIKNIKSNKVIRVEFVKSIIITATAGEGGKIEPDGVVEVEYQTSKVYAYTVTPDSGMIISSVIINDKTQLLFSYTEFVYDFVNVSKNCTIKAEFKDALCLFLIKASWYLEAMDQKHLFSNDTTWHPMIPEDRMFTDHKTFLLDGTYFETDKNGVIFGGPFEWSLSGKKLQIANLEYEIDYLDDNKMILILKLYDGALFKYTYTHILKK